MTKISPGDAYEIVAGTTPTPLILLCDHASSAVPAEYGDLGLAPWDVLHSGLIRHVPITLWPGLRSARRAAVCPSRATLAVAHFYEAALACKHLR